MTIYITQVRLVSAVYQDVSLVHLQSELPQEDSVIVVPHQIEVISKVFQKLLNNHFTFQCLLPKTREIPTCVKHNLYILQPVISVKI